MVLLQTSSASHRRFCKDGRMFWTGKKDSCFYIFNTFDRCALWQILWITFKGHNRLSQSPLLLVSGSGSSLSLCQQKHKKFLARSLRLRNILNLTWEQVFDLLDSSLLITVGNKGKTLWFCFETNWKNMKISWCQFRCRKLVGCGPSTTSCFRATRKS